MRCCARWRASCCEEKLRDSDTVARLGGDEFGMLLVGCPLDKARQIADDVCRTRRGLTASSGRTASSRSASASASSSWRAIEQLGRGLAGRGRSGLLRRQAPGPGTRHRVLGARRGAGAPDRRDPLAAEAAVGAEATSASSCTCQPIVPAVPATASRTARRWKLLVRMSDEAGERAAGWNSCARRSATG